jgi:hypothetical protein
VELPREAAPPFFIVGSARSGTTLLRLMLNAHPDVAVPPESRFIVELWDGSDEVDVEDVLVGLARHDQFSTWDLPIEVVRDEIGGGRTARYADVIDAAFRAYARLHGKSRWGDKTPRYVEHIQLLAQLWPTARFVHLIRDGRNVALSYADVPFGPKTIARAAQLWARRVSLGLAYGRALGPDRYLELRYEDLVADAPGRVKSLCEFLELEFDPGMLDYTEKARDAVLPRARRYNPHVTERPRSNVRSWEDEMPPAQIEVFEAVGGELLSLLDYPRRYPAVRRAARLRALLGLAGVPVDRLRRSSATGRRASGTG